MNAVVEQVKTYSSAFSRPARPIEIPAAIPSSPDSVARGRALFASQGCGACHGGDGRGGQRYEDGSGHAVFARDLTAPWAFRGGSRAQDIWLRLTTGIRPGPMPTYADVQSTAARWDLANFVVSLAFDHTGIYNVDEAFLGGGMRVGYYPHGYSVSSNLTSDPETGLGQWSVPQIVRALRDGQAPDRALSPFAMLWPFFHNFTDEDATAIATFLKTKSRPVQNLIPPKLAYGLIETIAMKFTRPLPATSPKALTYGDGNFAIGSAEARRRVFKLCSSTRSG